MSLKLIKKLVSILVSSMSMIVTSILRNGDYFKNIQYRVLASLIYFLMNLDKPKND